MKVLLIKDVKTLGLAGEIKEVKDGYGQNFLINKGLAKLATPDVIANWKAEQEKRAQDLKDELERLEKEKIALEAAIIRIEKQTAPVGIKGSVGNADISAAIKEQLNIDLDKKQINLKKALKSTGIHEVDAKLGHAIHAALKVEVVGV
ncbi:LSU ribosomal protein L9p [hydrothermal vent metagenome]|uniref:LSU ribosomal protein L9p n=1 Tax=hydrothermal vent metagenome TaxID=652676 RepID=A0A1W1EG15_9ZZZZ